MDMAHKALAKRHYYSFRRSHGNSCAPLPRSDGSVQEIFGPGVSVSVVTHRQNGTPLSMLQQLGGWKTLAMVMRYAHLGVSHLAEFADNVPRRRMVAGKSLAESPDQHPADDVVTA